MIGKGDFDLKPFTSACTLDIVCGGYEMNAHNNCFNNNKIMKLETVMGVRTNVQNGEPSDYSESLTK